MTYLVLDLETVADLTRWTPPADKPDAFAPVYAQRIVCVGYLVLTDGYEFAAERAGAFMPTIGDKDEQERMIVGFTSRMLADHFRAAPTTIVTFNGRSFDLPVIAYRAFLHGIQLPWFYKARDVRYRYSEQGHLDLCDALSDYGASTKASLDALAKMCGLPGKVGVDGSQVATLYRDGRLDEIASYCLADVAQTALVLLRFKLIQGELKHAEYEAKRDNLIAAFRRDPRLANIFAAPAMVPDAAIGAGDKPDSNRAGGFPVSGVVSAAG